MLYHNPINRDRLLIGRFCSIACGAKFLFNSANHTMRSLANYTFPLFGGEWKIDSREITSAWDNKGNIVVGNDVWIGYETVILAGARIGDGAVIGARDVPTYTVIGGVPANVLKKRFDTVTALLEMQWWNWPHERLVEVLPMIRAGAVDELMRYFRKMK